MSTLLLRQGFRQTRRQQLGLQLQRALGARLGQVKRGSNMGVSIVMGVPPNGWFMMTIPPIRMVMTGGWSMIVLTTYIGDFLKWGYPQVDGL